MPLKQSQRSTKGGASAPPTRQPPGTLPATWRGAQRRVGLLPHRRVVGGADDGAPAGRSTKGGASAPPTLVGWFWLKNPVTALNEGWGFCPTDADEHIGRREWEANRSTKGGASAPPTRRVRRVVDADRPALNEGWGFCPTDAAPPLGEDAHDSGRSTKGGASAPPTRARRPARSCSNAHAQRRVGLLPHRRQHTQSAWRCDSIAQRRVGLLPHRRRCGALVVIRLSVRAQRRVGLLPHRRMLCSPAK